MLAVRLFDRLPTGYVMTEAGEAEQLVRERTENEVFELSRNLASRDMSLQGSLRVTAPDGSARLVTLSTRSETVCQIRHSRRIAISALVNDTCPARTWGRIYASPGGETSEFTRTDTPISAVGAWMTPQLRMIPVLRRQYPSHAVDLRSERHPVAQIHCCANKVILLSLTGFAADSGGRSREAARIPITRTCPARTATGPSLPGDSCSARVQPARERR